MPQKIRVAFLVLLVLYAILGVFAHGYPFFGWDLEATRWLQSVRMAGFPELMRAVSFLGTGWTPYLLVGATGLFLLRARLRLEGVLCMAGVGLGALVNRIMKELVGRSRPEAGIVQVLIEYPNESFPSGHVVLFVQFFGFLAFLALSRLTRGWKQTLAAAGCLLLVVLVGISRVYLGAHWPSDVLGGYLLGTAWLILMISYYRSQKRGQKSSPSEVFSSQPRRKKGKRAQKATKGGNKGR